MKYGGLFRTPLITDDSGVQHWSCIAWGEITRNSVEKCRSKSPYCEFALRLKKGIFLNCIIRKRSSVYDIAKGLEAGDYIVAFGTYTERPYITKKDTKYSAAGTEKVSRSFEISFFVPGQLLNTLFNNLYGVFDAPPDPMLSAKDAKKKPRKPKKRDSTYDKLPDFGAPPDWGNPELDPSDHEQAESADTDPFSDDEDERNWY